MMETSVKKLFERYERAFNLSLAGDVDMHAVRSLYASEFIAATPAGLMAGRNNDRLEQVMAHGYARYRAIGMKGTRIRDVRLSPIDDLHCVAHVAWTAVYARKDHREVSIDFDVHYFVRTVNGVSKVFGWVAGDERALLEQHGIV